MMLDECISMIKERGFNTFFVAVADTDGAIQKQTLVPANPCCNCYSVAKVFTVTAIGMLCDQGLLTPQTYMADVLSAYLPADMDQRFRRVTIHDLLLHKVGFDSGKLDIDAEDASMFEEDYLQSVLSSPLAFEPGTTEQYTDAAYYILSRIVAQAAGMDLADFLRPTLMKTMKFKEFAWSVCPYGYSMGATGLYLRTEDMVKLGMVYMNGGVWNDTRIVSKEWVNAVFANGYEFRPMRDGWYGKSGMHGQMLLVNPSEKTALACHSFDDRVSQSMFG